MTSANCIGDHCAQQWHIGQNLERENNHKIITRPRNEYAGVCIIQGMMVISTAVHTTYYLFSIKVNGKFL